MAKKKTFNNELINSVKTQLIEEKLYSTKDSLLFSMLQNTYSQYLEAVEKIEIDGLIIEYLDDNQNLRKKPNPYYSVAIELSKEIFKYLNALYMTPVSRKLLEDAKNKKDEDDPLTLLTKQMSGMDKIEKR
jgi:P27 family predicted phage terminase small subunit